MEREGTDPVRLVRGANVSQLWDERYDPTRIYKVTAFSGILELTPWNRAPRDDTFMTLRYATPSEVAVAFKDFRDVRIGLAVLMDVSLHRKLIRPQPSPRRRT